MSVPGVRTVRLVPAEHLLTITDPHKYLYPNLLSSKTGYFLVVILTYRGVCHLIGNQKYQVSKKREVVKLLETNTGQSSKHSQKYFPKRYFKNFKSQK